MKINIAPDLKLDPDYVGGGTFALLAKKGAGKSYTTRVMAEEFWRTQVPFVLMDPMGANWGLRSSADGKSEGIPVAIFGGKHGDGPLEKTSGALMADLVVDEGLSMILDMSDLGSRSAERRFAQEFFERLYRRNSQLVHLLVDEADLFAPQKPQAGDRELLGITENIVRRGRNHGIGITLISQRPAVLNKDVLTQIDGLVAMRTVGLTDREAIDHWIEGHGEDAELAKSVKGSLASLENGECWWWVPELGVLKRVQVRLSETFDSSPTKKRGEKPRQPKGYAEVDLTSIQEKINDTIERAKADDPRVLKKRVSDLEAEVTKQYQRGHQEGYEQGKQDWEATAEPEIKEVPVFTEGELEDLQKCVEELGQHSTEIAGNVAHAQMALDMAKKMREGVMPTVQELVRKPLTRADWDRPPPGTPPAQVKEERRSTKASNDQAPPSRVPGRSAVVVEGQTLAKAERLVLSTLFQYPQGRSKTQVAILTGYKHNGGGFNNALSKLRGMGLIGDDRGLIRITEQGHNLVVENSLAHPLPTGPELLSMWLGKLGKAERMALQVLVDNHPRPLDKEELAEATGYVANGGGFNNALSKLRTLELIEGRGEMRASDDLF